MRDKSKEKQTDLKSKMASHSWTRKTYDSLPLTRWLDKSGKPIEDHPELPKEPPEKTILRKSKRIPIEIILKSKIVKETLRQKAMILTRWKQGTAQIDDELNEVA